METIPYRPLGIIKTVLKNTGFEISHCYEDLVFVNHTAFLLRMEEKGEDVSLLFNVDSPAEAREGIKATLEAAGKKEKLNIVYCGTYKLVENKESSTVDIHTYPVQSH